MSDGPSIRPIAQALTPLQEELTHLVEQRDALAAQKKAAPKKKDLAANDELTEYKVEGKKQQSASDLTKKIHQTMDQILSTTTQYAAVHPLSSADISYLKEYEAALQTLNKKDTAAVLPKLHSLIDQISAKALGRAHFQMEATLVDKIKFALEHFKNFFIEGITSAIHAEIFSQYHQKLIFQKNEKSMQTLIKEVEELENRLLANPRDQKLQQELRDLGGQVRRLDEQMRPYRLNLNTAKTTRKQLSQIGGTHIALHTKDGITLDGTYMNAQGFQKKCIESGGKSLTITIPYTQEQAATITGLVFPTGQQADAFMKTLDALKLFKSPDSEGSGWIKVRMGDRIAILPDTDVKDLVDRGILSADKDFYQFTEAYEPWLQLREQPLTVSPEPAGTIILGCGSEAVYEMQKREALALLMQGMNVMLYNHRGIGESSGTPSEKGAYEDVETVYQYLKQTHHTEDSKIFARGFCLSGGIMAELASRHPQINVIFDQTYADISDAIFKFAMESLGTMGIERDELSTSKKIALKLLEPIVKAVVSLLSPEFSTTKHIKQIEGNILFLRAADDILIDKAVTDKMIDTYAKGARQGTTQRAYVAHMPGAHATHWLDVKDQGPHLGRYHMLSFLQASGGLNPFADGGSSLRSLQSEYRTYMESQSSEAKDLAPPSEASS